MAASSFRVRAAADPPTTATPLDADTLLRAEPGTSGRGFTLEKGGARFVVAHDDSRPFRVHVRGLLVEDLGTIFSVRLISNAIVDVEVEAGRVRVVTAVKTLEVAAGERRTFDATPPVPGQDVEAVEATSVSAADAGDEPPAGSRRQALLAWRPLAESGQYREAFESIRRAGPAVVRDDTGELLLAGDAARLSDHPSEAAAYLEQVLRSHGGDPRASLAAFTLGRVLLDELGRPAEAARAFERARQGELAEDALAREVEACSRAGDTARARDLAVEYSHRHPNGRRARAVAKFGGLE